MIPPEFAAPASGELIRDGKRFSTKLGTRGGGSSPSRAGSAHRGTQLSAASSGERGSVASFSLLCVQNPTRSLPTEVVRPEEERHGIDLACFGSVGRGDGGRADLKAGELVGGENGSGKLVERGRAQREERGSSR